LKIFCFLEDESESSEEDYDAVYEKFVEEERVCPLAPEYTLAEFNIKDVQAKYKTRPDKFLTSVLMNGPNNQLLGLRETMFIAIKLNRSYIMVSKFPYFFEQYFL